MENLQNLEIFHIETRTDGLWAYLSYQDKTKIGNINNGYEYIEIKINPRDFQKSIRGNALVDQSVKNYRDVVSSQ
jgi:hypothetical protein